MAQNINLIERRPPRAADSEPVRRAALWLALLVTVIFAATVLQSRVLSSTRAELARVQAETERLQREQSGLAAPNAALIADLGRDEKDVAALESVAHLLQSGRLGRTRGFTEDLRAFGRATVSGVWFTAMRLDSVTDSMTLEGRAVDSSKVPGLLHALQAEPHFAGTRFASIELRPADTEPGAPPTALNFKIATPVADENNPPPADPRAPEAGTAARTPQ